MSKPKSRRIPKPFCFGIIAVVMVVLAVFLQVWLPYHREQIAIREIKRLGGIVNILWDGPEWIEEGPEWLQKVVDDGWLSWFDRVRSVYFAETAKTDEGLKHLSGLANFKSLWILDTQISDEGLKHLSGLANLEILLFFNTQISDEGLKHLGSLTNLTVLTLNNTQISDDGLKHLSGLTSLVDLDLENTQVTKEGVKKLQKALPDCYIHY